ncbi:MAG: hypothetical protein ITG07_00285 [Candidimonas sp.]|nr:hypothetical protein [Candidimonas sp.]
MSVLARYVRTVALLALVALPYTAHSTPTLSDGIPKAITSATTLLKQTLHNTGITQPVLLSETGESQEFFLPVPRTVRIEDGRLSFHARYLLGRPEGGMLQLLVDGQPVYAQAHTGSQGELNLEIELPAREYPDGFLRLGVNWLSDQTLRACEVEPTSVNSLSVLPSTGIAYRIASEGPLDLVTAWHLVPAQGRLTIASSHIAAGTFDAAWRVGTALERAGKRVQIHAMPAAGSHIDLSELDIPPVLDGHPVVAQLRNRGPVSLGNEAQIGALLLLDTKSILGDVAILDAQLIENITSALKSFADSLTTPAQQRWYESTIKAVHLQLESDSSTNDIFVLGTQPSRILAIRESAGSQASAVFGQLWRNTLMTSSVSVGQARAMALSPSKSLRLSNLGATARSKNVANYAAWQTSFSYASVDFRGAVPAELVLDIAAAPDTSGARPVISVTWNDILLTATRLQADGEKEQITARIPPYAIGRTNNIKVALQRLPSASHCTERQVGFPLNVLPTTHITTKAARGEPTFLGVMPLIADKADLVLPESWLEKAPQHLVQAIRLASASGLSPESATLRLQQPDASFKPEGSFVAMAVKVANAKPKSTITDDGHVQISGDKVAMFDIAGLHDVASVEVMRVDKHMGLYWTQGHPVDEDTGVPATDLMPYDLDRGDLAIVASTGVITWLDSGDIGKGGLTDRVNSAFYEWRRLFSWGVPTILGLLFLVLLMLAMAYRAGRRKAGK